MKKKGLSIFLALAMCVGLLPTTAMAAEDEDISTQSGISVQAEEHKHCICGAEHQAVGDHTNDIQTTFTAWTSSDSLPSTAGNYYLTEDVTLSQNRYWVPANGTVLCLNGHSITGQNDHGTIYYQEQGITFTLTDCNGSGLDNGKITHVSGTTGSGVNIGFGTFNMYGGKITGNSATSENQHMGGGVYVGYGNKKNGTFNMYGGKITGNTANFGGGVYLYSNYYYKTYGVLNMYGGSITDNNATQKGGGVYVSSTDYQNQVASKITVGGNATITGNTVDNTENNIYLNYTDNGYGPTVTVNNDFVGTVGVVVNDKNEGKALVSNNADGKITSDTEGYTITADGKAQSGGNTPSTGHTHYLCGKTHKEIGNHTTDTEITFEKWDNTDSLPTEAGNYYLTDNVTISETWEPADGVVLCLNGNSILLNNCDSTELTHVVKVTNHFTLTDCKTGNTQGKIMHVIEEDPTKGKGVGVEVFGGTFDMYGGNISDNKAAFIYGAGGVAVRSENAFSTGKKGTFNMCGGKISNNQARFGGGVSVMWGAAFHMMGGEISSNLAGFGDSESCNGGGVYVGHNSTFIMSGGEIKNNTAKNDGGGVYLSAFAKQYEYQTNQAALFEVSGDAKIAGNSVDGNTNNVYLDSSTSGENSINATITITDALTGEIGVTTANAPTEGNAITIATGATSGTDYSKNIKSDNTSYEVQHRGSTLVLAVPGDEPQPSDHIHNWTYAEKTDANDTIVARCNVDGCTEPDGGWVKINAPENLIYDGQAKAATLTASNNWQGKDVSQIGIQYQTRFEDGTGSQLYDTPPTEPGTYRAWIELPTNVWAAYVEYTIVKADNGNSSSSSSGGGHSSRTSYTVSSTATDNGAISSNVKTARKGDTVTITVQPENGYKLDKLTVTDANGNALTVTDKGDGTYTFTMPNSKVEITPTFVAETTTEPEPDPEPTPETNPFTDVHAEDYFFDAVKWAADKNITGGIDTNLFGPNIACTRAQIVTFLWRAAGSPAAQAMSSFFDVAEDAYYAKAVAWAVENGITNGTSEDTFSPDLPCTRAQSMTFLYRASKAKAPDGTPAFSDVAADAYYAAAVKWATENNITSGMGDELFGPDYECTRAQIVTFLYRLYTK